MLRRTRRTLELSLLLGTLAGASASAQSFPAASGAADAPLAVPYLAQSTLLCGGAAAAMLERWWGRRGVDAEDFAALVRPSEGGIRTNELAESMRRRGWTAETAVGSTALLRSLRADGLPVMVLLQVGRRRYHYVVILAWSPGHVTVHDPAIGPSRRLEIADFEARWTGAGRWMMIVRPAAPAVAPAMPAVTPAMPAVAPAPPSADSSICAPTRVLAITTAAGGDLDAAAALLEDAHRTCPSDAVLLRDLAGVRFRQQRYTIAAALAATYLDRMPDDTLGWNILGSSWFLTDNRVAALAAWNEIGRPQIDIVDIRGVRDTPYRLLLRTMRFRAHTLLTPRALLLASRRLGDVPSMARASVSYRPIAGGLVEVQANVAERPSLQRWPWLLARMAAHAGLQQQLRLDAPNLLRHGENWSGTYRWQHARSTLSGRADLPVTAPMSLVVSMAAGWDRFRFAPSPTADAPDEESRRSASVGVGGWLTPSLRATMQLRRDRWSANRRYIVTGAGAQLRLADDRLAMRFDGARAFAGGAGAGYVQGSADADWASERSVSRRMWAARIGVDAASAASPVGMRPVVGGTLTYMIPLRAHAGLDNGSIARAAVGRLVLHGGLSIDQPVHRMGPFVLAGGLFMDGARIVDAPDATLRTATYIDIGAGLRLGIADGQLGVVRIDLATGLADRRTALTAGVQSSWPVTAHGDR